MTLIERAARALCEEDSEDPEEMMEMINGEWWPRWKTKVRWVEAVMKGLGISLPDLAAR